MKMTMMTDKGIRDIKILPHLYLQEPPRSFTLGIGDYGAVILRYARKERVSLLAWFREVTYLRVCRHSCVCACEKGYLHVYSMENRFPQQ